MIYLVFEPANLYQD